MRCWCIPPARHFKEIAVFAHDPNQFLATVQCSTIIDMNVIFRAVHVNRQDPTATVETGTAFATSNVSQLGHVQYRQDTDSSMHTQLTRGAFSVTSNLEHLCKCNLMTGSTVRNENVPFPANQLINICTCADDRYAYV